MWETGICGPVVGGWFWIIPLAFMTLCFIMFFVGRKKGPITGCKTMNPGERTQTGRPAGEPVEETIRRHYAAGEIGREEFQPIISDLAE